MKDLDNIKMAKVYIEKMANGINPLTDRSINENDLINDVRISRCLFYVTKLLDEIVHEEENFASKKTGKKVCFRISKNQLLNFEYSQCPIPLSEICKRINNTFINETIRKISYKDISPLLVSEGILKEETGVEGGKKKVPTEKGKSIGVSYEKRTYENAKEYYVTVYSINAQQYILDLVADKWGI